LLPNTQIFCLYFSFQLHTHHPIISLYSAVWFSWTLFLCRKERLILLLIFFISCKKSNCSNWAHAKGIQIK
jgi:hypothetical protein